MDNPTKWIISRVQYETRLFFNQWRIIRESVYLLLVMFASSTFSSCDLELDIDPMTLIYELELNIAKMYLHARNEVRARTGQRNRQTDT